MPYSLGLDLGTTTITAAVGSRSRVTVVATGARGISTPALVVATGRRLVTGHAAEVRSIGNVDRTATAVLDSLGDDTPVVINGHAYPPAELLRTILDDVIAGVAAQQHEQPDQLTVTHPTHWSPRQIAALRDAVWPLAPHGQLQLVANAAAVAADHATTHRLPDGAAVAVCDLGATAYEVSVIGRRGDRLVLLSPRVKHGGFGGDQFDQALMNIADRQLAGHTARLRAEGVPDQTGAGPAAARLPRGQAHPVDRRDRVVHRVPAQRPSHACRSPGPASRTRSGPWSTASPSRCAPASPTRTPRSPTPSC